MRVRGSGWVRCAGLQLWDACLTVALVWTLLAVPFRIAFEPQYFECESSLGSLHECSWGFMVDLTVNLMFILDVLVVFCTGVWVTQEVRPRPLLPTPKGHCLVEMQMPPLACVEMQVSLRTIHSGAQLQRATRTVRVRVPGLRSRI